MVVVVVVIVLVVVDVVVNVVVEVVVVVDVVVVVVVVEVVVVVSGSGKLERTTGLALTAAPKSSKSISSELNGFNNGADSTLPSVSGSPAGNTYK